MLLLYGYLAGGSGGLPALRYQRREKQRQDEAQMLEKALARP
jgi:hypothetical protein